MDEVFFFMYHLGRSKEECMSMVVHERKWIINRFITQKKKESEEVEKSKRRMKSK